MRFRQFSAGSSFHRVRPHDKQSSLCRTHSHTSRCPVAMASQATDDSQQLPNASQEDKSILMPKQEIASSGLASSVSGSSLLPKVTTTLLITS